MTWNPSGNYRKGTHLAFTMTAALVQRVLNGLLHKYLKNVTTETATLWGGELVFKNVELRLDVLQEELGLPLVFSRGFIQELKVFLPLRNLLREQVRITLSNIEVVAQTPKEVDENNTMRFPGGAASNSSPAKQGQHKARGGGQEGEDGGMNEGGEGGEEGAQGWVRSMLARIALNIKVFPRLHPCLLLLETLHRGGWSQSS